METAAVGGQRMPVIESPAGPGAKRLHQHIALPADHDAALGCPLPGLMLACVCDCMPALKWQAQMQGEAQRSLRCRTTSAA